MCWREGWEGMHLVAQTDMCTDTHGLRLGPWDSFLDSRPTLAARSVTDLTAG